MKPENAALITVIDRTHDALRGLDDAVIGAALGHLVRGEPLDAVAEAQRPALLRLCFLQHVLQPSLQTGALVTSMMRTMLMGASASSLDEMIDDIKATVDEADAGGTDIRLWLLIGEGMRRGFVGTRAQAAARAAELWTLDDETVGRLLREGLPHKGP